MVHGEAVSEGVALRFIALLVTFQRSEDRKRKNLTQRRKDAEKKERQDHWIDLIGSVSGLAPPSPCSTKQSESDRKSTRLNSSHTDISRMPSSA